MRKWWMSLVIVLILTMPLVRPAIAAEITFDRASLQLKYAYSNTPIEINHDAQGNFIVSDDGGIIWVINPVNLSYHLYDTYVINLTDATPAEEGFYFTDNVDGIGFTNLLTKSLWFVPQEDQGQIHHSFGPIEIDAAGGVWAIEWNSTDSKIYKISRNESTLTVCALIPTTGGPDYGTYAYELIYHNGFLWWYNSFEEEITRLNPVPVDGAYTIEYWDLGLSNVSIEGRGLDFDAAGNFWFSGGPAASILSFNPQSEELTTYTVQTGSPSIEGVAVNGSEVWYADHRGSIGRLSPGDAEKTTTSLAPAKHSFTVNSILDCDVLESTPEVLYATESGTLGITNPTLTSSTPNPGWTIYTMSDNDELNGIDSVPGFAFVSEKNLSENKGEIIRINLTSLPEYKVFLPLIIR